MPIYEYFCEQCKNTQEILQKQSDPVPMECEHCHAQKSLKRIISQSSFMLKGSGWYKDLYSSAKKEATPQNKTEKKENKN